MPNDSLKLSAVKVNTGSGCLFQPLSDAYTYVLTARHCLIDALAIPPYGAIPVADINVYAQALDNSRVPLRVIRYFVSQDPAIDTAILLVEKVTETLQDIHCDYPVYGEEAVVFGYPNFRSTGRAAGVENAEAVEYLTCLIRMVSMTEMKFDIDSTNSLYSFSRGGIENAKGFSGSGIYVTRGGDTLLVGILVKVKNPDGVFDRLSAFGIEHYNSLLIANSTETETLAPLVPECLANFSTYLGNVFQYDNLRLETLMHEASRAIALKGINPQNILKKFKNKLFLPQDKHTSVLNAQLWQGWLEMLAFLSLEDDAFTSLSDITWSNRYFFYMGRSSWANVVKHLLDIGGQFKPGSKFIFNNEHSSPEPPKLSAQRVSRMLTNIASGNELLGMAGRMHIDQAQIATQFLFVHIQEFKRIFALEEEGLLAITDAGEFKSRIQLLLNKVFSHD